MKTIKSILKSILNWLRDLISIDEHNVSAVLIVFIITWIVVLVFEYCFNHPLSQTLATCLNYLTGGAIGTSGTNIAGNAVNTYTKLKSDISTGNVAGIINDITSSSSNIQTNNITNNNTTQQQTGVNITSGQINTNV